MPTYNNPFENGRLIIAFSVDFPESINPQIVHKLEAILPPKIQPMSTEECEEVDLIEFDQESSKRSGGHHGGRHGNPHHHGDDEDDEQHGTPCATQ